MATVDEVLIIVKAQIDQAMRDMKAAQEAARSLEADAQKGVNAIGEAGEKASLLGKEGASGIAGLASAFAPLAMTVQGAISAFGVLRGAVDSVVGAMQDAYNEYSISEKAVVTFNAVVESSGRVSAASAKEMLDFASRMQDLTGESDDAVLSMEAFLVSMGRSAKQTQELITAAANLSVVTGTDLRTAVEQLNLTYSGNAGRLARLIPELKNLTEEELATGAAIDIVNQKFDGYAESVTNTTSVLRERWKQTWGDMKEAVGSVIAPVFNSILSIATDMVKKAVPVVLTIGAVFKNFPTVAKETFALVLDIIKAALSWTSLKTIITSLGEYFVRTITSAFKTIPTIFKDAVELMFTPMRTFFDWVKDTFEKIFSFDLKKIKDIKGPGEYLASLAKGVQVGLANIGSDAKKLFDAEVANIKELGTDLSKVFSTVDFRGYTAKLQPLLTVDVAGAKIDPAVIDSPLSDYGTGNDKPNDGEKAAQGLLDRVRDFLKEADIIPKTADELGSFFDQAAEAWRLLDMYELTDKARDMKAQISDMLDTILAKYSEAMSADQLAEENARTIEQNTAYIENAIKTSLEAEAEDASRLAQENANRIEENTGVIESVIKTYLADEQDSASRLAQENANRVTETTDAIEAAVQAYLADEQERASALAQENANAVLENTDRIEKAIQEAIEREAYDASALAQANANAVMETTDTIERAIQEYNERMKNEASQTAQENANRVLESSDRIEEIIKTHLAQEAFERETLAQENASAVEERTAEIERAIKEHLAQEAFLAELAERERTEAAINAAQAVEENSKRIEAAIKYHLEQQDILGRTGFKGSRNTDEYGNDIGYSGGTEVGNLLTGVASLSELLTNAAMNLAMMVLSVESVNKVLNPLQTVMEGIMQVVQPLLDTALQPIVDILVMIGQTLGMVVAPAIFALQAILAPVIAILQPFVGIIRGIAQMFAVFAQLLTVINPILTILRTVAGALGTAFAWLYNNVIRPLGNAIITIVNAIIDGINGALGWLGVHINRLSEMAKLEDMSVKLEEATTSVKESIQQKLSLVNEEMSALQSRARELYNEQISSLKTLLKLGLISENEYQRKLETLNNQMAEINGDKNSALVSKLTDIAGILEAIRQLQAVKEKLNAGQDVAVPGLAEVVATSSAATGTSVSAGSTGNITVNLTVTGSVIAEQDLAKTVKRAVDVAVRRGSVEAFA